jgi:hypothetical protein
MQHAVETAPQTIQTLSRPEHLLVWALRAVALGHEDDPVVIRTFRRACGEHGLRTLDAYCAFVRCVGMVADRRLKVHVPGCPCVSEDECAVVACLAAAQRSLTLLDEARLQHRLEALMGRHPGEALIFLAQAIGRFLLDADLTLPAREGDLANVTPRRPTVVLH